MGLDEAVTINDLSEFTGRVLAQPVFVESPRWYRGCGKSSYELIPTLYRHPTAKSVGDLMALESQIIDRFKERSMPYLPGRLTKDWEYLFLMQHYGVPTRLLDWTENPFFALFFALSSADCKNSNGEKQYSDDAAVWILNPVDWNQWALKEISFSGSILSFESDYLQAYLPKTNWEYMSDEPLAIYGVYNSPRIATQRGVFTIFGKYTCKMESKKFPETALSKLIIPKDHIASIFDELTSIGITDSSLFPDLEGLARELKRSLGYRV